MQEVELTDVAVPAADAPVRRSRTERSRALLYRYAVVLVFVWGYRKGREDERRERGEGEPKR